MTTVGDRRRDEVVQAVLSRDPSRARALLEGGAPTDGRSGDGQTALMIAAGTGQPGMVRLLLAHGADVFVTDRTAGATALHKASQGGHLEIVRLLLDAGALVDAATATTGHTPLVEAMWFKWPEVVECLLARGAGLQVTARYGFTVTQHLEYELRVNRRGRERLERIRDLVEARRAADRARVEAQVLMAAVAKGDLDGVRRALAAGAAVDERAPVLNGFDDQHTPLLVACREGHVEIARELLRAGADVNAAEPTFGAVPLHKATYNGHLEITRLLAAQPGVHLDVRGPSNGYTPLHDALWHGFAACAEVLVEAGARLDLHGHDGKTPLDLAVESLGPEHELTQRLRSAGAPR